MRYLELKMGTIPSPRSRNQPDGPKKTAEDINGASGHQEEGGGKGRGWVSTGVRAALGSGRAKLFQLVNARNSSFQNKSGVRISMREINETFLDLLVGVLCSFVPHNGFPPPGARAPVTGSGGGVRELEGRRGGSRERGGGTRQGSESLVPSCPVMRPPAATGPGGGVRHRRTVSRSGAWDPGKGFFRREGAGAMVSVVIESIDPTVYSHPKGVARPSLKNKSSVKS